MKWLEWWIGPASAPRPDEDLVDQLRTAPRRTFARWVDHECGYLVGTVMPLADHPLISPLSGRECVGWSMQIAGKRHVVRRTAATPFAVVGGTRRAIVPPERLRPLLDVTHRRARSTIYDVRDDARLLVEATDGMLATESWQRQNQHFEFIEGVLKAGDRVAVVGIGALAPDRDGLPPTTAGDPYRAAGTMVELGPGAIVTNDPLWIDG